MRPVASFPHTEDKLRCHHSQSGPFSSPRDRDWYISSVLWFLLFGKSIEIGKNLIFRHSINLLKATLAETLAVPLILYTTPQTSRGSLRGRMEARDPLKAWTQELPNREQMPSLLVSPTAFQKSRFISFTERETEKNFNSNTFHFGLKSCPSLCSASHFSF